MVFAGRQVYIAFAESNITTNNKNIGHDISTILKAQVLSMRLDRFSAELMINLGTGGQRISVSTGMYCVHISTAWCDDTSMHIKASFILLIHPHSTQINNVTL
jgi:hypothetical protein